MLILPITNKKNIVNVEFKIKNAYKVRHSVHFDDSEESEIIINSEKYSDSIYSKQNEKTSEIDFIRSKSILFPRPFFVTTRNKKETNLYDVYEVPQPPKKVNDSLDILYNKAITDLRKETPEINNKGRYISLEEIGLYDFITNELINKIQKIVKTNNKEEWNKLLESDELKLIEEIIDFLKIFDFNIIKDSYVKEDSIQESIKALSLINSKDYRNLNKYYEMSKSNTDIYTKLSYINRILHGKPLSLIHNDSKEKQLIKKMEEVD